MRSPTRSTVTMIVLWMSLLFLHQAYPLVPVKTVRLGEPANLTCALPQGLSSRKVYWYKQSFGDTLKLIVILYKTTAPEYGPEFSSLRFHLHNDNSFSNLTILTTTQEDEGFYHCGILEWINPQWNGTYLLVKGNIQRTSNYTVVQWPTVFGPVHPGDTATLKCSVLSDSDSLCPGYDNVIWFRAGSDKSHPNIIYTDRNGHNGCEKTFDSRKRCVYRFSKNVTSSDAGTFYCAVTTCGEILFGNGTTLEVEEKIQSVFIEMAILITCLAISVTGNVVLIFYQRVCNQFKGTESAISEAQTDNLHQPIDTVDHLNYAALNFSDKKTRGRRKREFAEDSVYSQVKC